MTGLLTFSRETFPIIAGPCVIESEEHVLKMAHAIAAAAERLNQEIIFKVSFDKANRTSINSYRGVSLDEALAIFQRIKDETSLAIATDVHTPDQAARLAEVIDLIQVPAFLCRQTDMLTSAAATKLPVTVKKGQFLSPWEAVRIAAKLRAAGCTEFAIIERGSSFGYNNLVNDMRSFPILHEHQIPVIFDATHSAQLPGGAGDITDGLRQYIPAVARAAAAAGCDGLFVEVHDDPEQALSDSTTQWPLDRFDDLIIQILVLRRAYLEATDG